MKLDRDLQRKLLVQMSEAYPDPLRIEAPEADHSPIKMNVAYLQEHGLCRVQHLLAGRALCLDATITAAGLDFLEDDGGLTARRGVVIVRLEAETLRALIAARVDAAALPAEQKSAIKRHLASLSQKALEAATTFLVQEGLKSLSDLPGWLHKLAGL
jgi:hypothetical protein